MLESAPESLSDTSPPSAIGWRWAPAWVLVFVALWPVHAYAEGVLVLGALVMLLRMYRTRTGAPLLSSRAFALTTVLFVAYWLPQLISSIGALDVRRALTESLVDLRYLPFLWLAAAAVANPRGRRITLTGLALIVLVWSVDALLEAVAGTSPLFWGIDQVKLLVNGKSMCTLEQLAASERLGGIFGACNVKLGLVLASLSPFLLVAARRRFGALGWALAAFMTGTVIILAGSRASWLTFALVLLCSGLHLLGWKKTLASLLAGVLVLGCLSLAVPNVGQRVIATGQALDGSVTGVDSALSGRLRVWSAALCIIADNPLNGVGTRGFRAAFADCDPAPQEPSIWGEGPALHAHQIVLELLSETGIIGLLLWLCGALLAWRAWRLATPEMRQQAYPAMLALAVTVFPFNTHLAFYSTLWGGLTLLLTALYAGSLLGESRGGGGGATWWTGRRVSALTASAQG